MENFQESSKTFKERRQKEKNSHLIMDKEGRPVAWQPDMARKYRQNIIAGTSTLNIEQLPKQPDENPPLRVLGYVPRFDYDHLNQEKRDELSKEKNDPEISALMRRKVIAGRSISRFLRVLGGENFDLRKVIKVNQVHGNKVIVIDKKYLEKDKKELARVDADGMITNTPGITLLMQNSDCPSFTVYDPDKKVVGLAHCGLKGLLAGITKSLVENLEKKYEANPGNFHVAISPGAGALEYEVDKKDFEIMIDQDKNLKSAFIENPNSPDKYYLDLNKVIEIQLLKLGVKLENIESSSLSTIEEKMFVSHRREGNKRSTNISVVGLQ